MNGNNMFMRSLVSFFLMLHILACNNHKGLQEEKYKGLKLIDAKYNNWTAGIKGGGFGVEFYFTVIAMADIIKIDSVLINNEKLKTISKPKDDKRYYDFGEIKYNKGDTILIRVSSNSHYNKKNNNNQLLYFIDSIKHTLILDTLIQIQTENPQ